MSPQIIQEIIFPECSYSNSIIHIYWCGKGNGTYHQAKFYSL